MPARREAARRHRRRAHGGGRLRHRGAGAPRRQGRLHRRQPDRRPRARRGNGGRRRRRRHLQPHQVHAQQPEHQHQPAAAGARGRRHREGRRHRRRRVDRHGRARARPEHAGRVHAVERLQLRGLDPDLRARGRRRPLHVDPHRGALGRRSRHQARPRGNHARHLEPGRSPAGSARRRRHRLYRRRSRGRRRAGRQGHAEGRDAAHAGREAPARDLRRKGVRREGHEPARAVGHLGLRDRRAGVHARRHRARQARRADHRRRAEGLSQGPERPAADRRERRVRADREDAARQDGERRARSASPRARSSPRSISTAFPATTGSTSAFPARNRRGSWKR